MMVGYREEKEDGRKSLHQRIYPYMDHVVQYAIDTEDKGPWIVRDRGEALRSERRGYGRAMMRTWVPTDWSYVNEEETY